MVLSKIGRHLSFVIATVAVGVSAGCGGSSASGGGGNNGNPGDGTPGTVVTDNPTSTVDWSSIEGRSGVAATMRVNDKGTTVDEIPVTIASATVMDFNVSGHQETGVEALNCQPNNGRGVFEGDSGSPVLINGSIVGGLFGSSDDIHFFARGIQQMEETASGPPVLRSASASTARIQPQWYFQGSRNVLGLLRSRPNFSNTIYTGVASGPTKRPVIGGGGVAPIPGRRYASPFVNGPYAVGFDMATYTLELSDGNWIATGHGLEDAGTVSWPVMSVNVTGLDSSSDSVTADVLGDVYGTLLYDGEQGSLIDPNSAAATMPVVETDTLNGVPQASATYQVRFDLGSSTENEGIEVAATATIDALENDTTNLTASGTMKYVVGGSTVTKTLTFPAKQTLSALENTLQSDIDAILVAQNKAAPSSQIQSVTITLAVTG